MAPARRPGRRTGLERGLDGSGDELRGLRVDDDVPAEQHAACDEDWYGILSQSIRSGRRPVAGGRLVVR